MKKYIKLLFFGLVLFTVTLSILLINHNYNVINATDVENPKIAVHKKNISYSGEIHIVYAISYEGFDPNTYPVKMLFYNSVQNEYTKENASYEVTTVGKLVIADKSCVVFESKGLAAKQMTEDIYGRAYVEINGETIYTDVVKYSVLEYSYETLGKVDEKITKLLEAMKYYGSLAQINFGYLLDRLADEVYFNVNVIGGTLEDGFTQGRYIIKDIVTLTANAPIDGYKFLYWQDENKNIVSVDPVINVEVSRSFTYEAVFVPLQVVTLTESLETEVEYNTPAGAIDLPDYVTVSNKEGINENVKVAWDTTTFDPELIGEQVIYGSLVDSDYILAGPLLIKVNVSSYTFEYNESTNEYAISKYYGLNAEETVPSTFKGIPVTTIKQFAFEDALALKNLIINSNIKTIEQEAISYCDNLEKITVPFVGGSMSSNTYFGYIFGATSYSENNIYTPRSLSEVTIKDGTTSISSYAFNDCAYIKTIKIPSGVKTIDSYAFKECSNLITINLSKDLTNVYSNAFNNCLKLTNVYYENTVEDWCNISFSSSTSNPMYYATSFYMLNENGNYEEVTEINVPNTVNSIKQYQFYSFDNITKVILPNTIISIGQYAFNNCTYLINLEFCSGITTFDSSAFYNCTYLENVYFNGTIEEWCSISFTNMHSNPMYYASNFYIKNESGEYESVTEIILPNTVRVINDYQFYGFENVAIFTLSSRIKCVGTSAFYNCTSVEEVYFSGTISAWNNILFESLESNPMYTGAKLYTKDTGLYIEINDLPQDVEQISAYAFAGCESLVKIYLPTTVTTIGKYAFYNVNNLTDVYYDGTFEEYKTISISTYDFGLMNAVTHLLRDEIIPTAQFGQGSFLFGKYPQTVVTDTNIISELNNISAVNSLGYIEYKGCEYVKVTANPVRSNYTFINGSSIVSGKTYYFEVEPIKWKILYANDGIYKLLSDMILDTTEFYNSYEARTISNVTIYPNNYEYSNIRAWLNGYDGSNYNLDDYTNKGFIDIAFSEEERKLINNTLVDNSIIDKIYLLSINNVTSIKYGFDSSEYSSYTRYASLSDYARSKNCSMYIGSSYYGNGEWWLRTSDWASSTTVRAVNSDGDVYNYSYRQSSCTGIGIRVALDIIIE